MADLGLRLRLGSLLLVGEEWYHRAFITPIGVGGVVEDGEQPEIVFLTNGVVLVVVALGARHGGAHPDGQRGVDPIDQGYVAELFVAGATLIVGHRVPMERGGDLLLFGGLREQVTCELLYGEDIEWFVGVERAGDVVAVGPNRPGGIVGIPARIGVARQIEPQTGPVFAIGPRRQQLVDVSLVVRTWTVASLNGFGRQSGQVEAGAAFQGH